MPAVLCGEVDAGPSDACVHDSGVGSSRTEGRCGRLAYRLQRVVILLQRVVDITTQCVVEHCNTLLHGDLTYERILICCKRYKKEPHG